MLAFCRPKRRWSPTSWLPRLSRSARGGRDAHARWGETPRDFRGVAAIGEEPPFGLDFALRSGMKSLPVPVAEARNNFSEVIARARTGQRVRLTRHGKPVGWLIGKTERDQLDEAAPVKQSSANPGARRTGRRSRQ